VESQERRSLRVCHVAYTFYENDNRVIRYAEALAEQGDEVDVIALRRPGQTKTGYSGNVRVFRIQQRAVTEKSAWIYLAKVVWFWMLSTAVLTVRQLRKPYDIVHVHNIPDFLVFSALVPKLMGARVILDIHDIVPELYADKFGSGRRSGLFRALLFVERRSCAFADHVIVSNHIWHGRLVGRGVPAAKCTTMLNYPDLRLFKPLPEEKKRRDGTFVFLYPGTLNHHQGLDIAVKAFARVQDRMPNAEFHIYGEGPARAELERLASEARFGGRVKLMNRVPLTEIANVMALADVGVVPKRADGFGNEAFSTKILEFMACGIPVVVPRTQVDAYYFDDSLVRFFIPGDEADLASALLNSYECPDHADRVQAARTFATHLSWQERVVDYQLVIESLRRQRVSRTRARRSVPERAA
jgi:glycosyltransferase involved in cell wall biosynthesis